MKNIALPVLLAALASCSAVNKKDTNSYNKSTETTKNDIVVDVETTIKTNATVYYGFDSEKIENSEKEKVSAQAAYIASEKPDSITIEAHTDERGTNEYNLGLSNRRGKSHKEALVSYLSKLGVKVNKKLISIKSFGYTKPAVKQASTESEHAQNRRSVLILK